MGMGAALSHLLGVRRPRPVAVVDVSASCAAPGAPNELPPGPLSPDQLRSKKFSMKDLQKIFGLPPLLHPERTAAVEFTLGEYLNRLGAEGIEESESAQDDPDGPAEALLAVG